MKNTSWLFRLLPMTLAAVVLISGGCKSALDPATRQKQAMVESKVPGLGEVLLKYRPDAAGMDKLFATYLEMHPEVYGVAFAPEPAAAGLPVLPCPYVYRKDGVITAIDLARPDYLYKDMEWYAKPVSKQRPVWTAPYFDKGGGDIWMVTYSMPLYLDAAKKQLYGVLTDDLAVTLPKK